MQALDRTAVPRRTRSSTQTTAIRPPLKRTAPTEETPTLPLTPIEVDSIVQGAEASPVVHADAPTRPTMEIFRPALGSAPIPTVEQAALSLSIPDVAAAAIAPSAKPDVAAAAIAPSAKSDVAAAAIAPSAQADVSAAALAPLAAAPAASATLAPLADAPAASAALAPLADAAAASAAIASAATLVPASTTMPSPERGQRRTREMFHRDAIRPPTRKP